MPYTNGAGSGDDINHTRTTAGLAALMNLVMMWVNPDSTGGGAGGDFLFSLGNVTGIAQGTTSSAEIRLTNDHVTTDGVFETTDVGLVAGEWRFIACLMSAISGSFVPRVWTGTADKPPVLHAGTTVTAASGNVTSSATVTVGNRGTGSVSFAGQIGQTCHLQAVAGTSGSSGWGRLFTVAGTGNAVAEAELLARVIQPAWRDMSIIRDMCVGAQAGNHDMTFFPMNSLIVDRLTYAATVVTNSGLAVANGSTISQQREPRAIPNFPLTRGSTKALYRR